MASNASGSCSNATRSPTTGRMAPAVEELEQVGLHGLALIGRRGVEARHGDGHLELERRRDRPIAVGEDHADDVEVAETEGAARDHRDLLGLDAAGEAHHQVATAATEATQRLHHDVAADPVEAHVDAEPVGLLEHHGGEVGLPVVDDHVGTEISRDLRLVLAADGGDDPGPRRHRQLDRGRPDATGRGVHQDGLARLQAASLVEPEVGQVERVEERRRLHVVELLRRLERHGRRAHGELGVGPCGPVAAERHPLPHPRLGTGPGADDLTDALHAERVRQRRIDGEVAAMAAVHLVVVEDAGRGSHQQLPRARLGIGNVDQLQRLGGRSVPRHLPCPHVRSPSRAPREQDREFCIAPGPMCRCGRQDPSVACQTTQTPVPGSPLSPRPPR